MSLNVLIDPYMSTVTNLVKSVETYSFVFGFGGNSITVNNSGIAGSLPVLFVQYLLTVLAVLFASDASLICKLDILASKLLDIRMFLLKAFWLNEGVLVLGLMPLRLLLIFFLFFAKAMFHQASSLFVTESKIGAPTEAGAQNNCEMGSLWKDSWTISLCFCMSKI